MDGGAMGFYANPDGAPTTAAVQDYVNATLIAPVVYQMQVWVMQMPSATAASGLYAYLPSPACTEPFYKVTWEEPTSPMVGTQSRIINPGTQWWINFYKGTYYVELFLASDDGNISTMGSSTTAAKAAVIDFATKLAAKM
jgi:hypothetical protein